MITKSWLFKGDKYPNFSKGSSPSFKIWQILLSGKKDKIFQRLLVCFFAYKIKVFEIFLRFSLKLKPSIICCLAKHSRIFSSLSHHIIKHNPCYIFSESTYTIIHIFWVLSSLLSLTSTKYSEGRIKNKNGNNFVERRQSVFKYRTMSKKSIKQTLESLITKIFHFLVASHYFYALYYDFVHVLPKEIPLRNYSFGSKLVYLTVLNAVSFL